MGETFLIISVILQAGAVVQAVRLALREKRAGWVFLGLAVFLMMARRTITIYDFVSNQRPADPLAEFIALIISLLMIGGLTLLLKWLKPAHTDETTPDDIHTRSMEQLKRRAILLALLSLLGCAGLSYFAYTTSRDAVTSRLLKGNLDLANMLAAAAHPSPDAPTAIQEIGRLWNQARSQYPDNYLCVIGPDSKLALNTRWPEKVGTFVGGMAINGREDEPRTVQELLAARSDWVGRNPGLDGEPQIQAYAYSTNMNALVAVHLPSHNVDAQIRAAALPWAAGIALIFIVVLPLSFGLLYYVGTSSQKDAFKAMQGQLQSEQHLRLAVGAANVGLWGWDLQTNAVWFSPEWKRQIGYEDHELPNRFEEWQSRVHPDDVERVLAAIKAHREKPGPDFGIEFRFRHKDGTYRWILTQAALDVDAQGQPARMLGLHLDITARKQADAELQKTFSTLELFVDSVPHFIAFVDAEERYQLVNRNYVEWFGQSHEKIIGRTLRELHRPATYEVMTPHIREVMAGQPVAFENRMTGRDGEEYCFEVRYVPRHSPDGAVMGYFVLALDVTARKQADETVRKYATVFQNAGWGMLIADPETRQLSNVNPAYARMHGYTPEEMIGMAVADTFAPEEKAKLPEYIRLANEMGHYVYESLHLRKDGTRFPCLTGATAFKDETGRVLFRAATIEDITERKRAEESLRESQAQVRAVADFSPIGIFMSTPDGQIVYDNVAIRRTLGRDPEEPIGDHWAEAVHPSDQERVFTAWKQFVAGDQAKYDMEFRFVRPDRTVHLVHARATQIHDGDRLLGFAGTAEDITERKQAEEALRRSREDLSAIIGSVDGIVWEVDAETFRFTFVSPRAERLLGYPVSKWIEEPTFWTDHIHPDDRERAMSFCLESTREKRDHEFEYRMLAADGRIVWLQDIVTVVVENDRTVKLRGIMVDITQRKQTEQRLVENEKLLTSVAESVPHSYLSVIEKDFTVGFTSGQEFRLQHLDPDIYLGKTVQEVFTPFGEKVLNTVLKAYERTFEGEEQTFELQIEDQIQLYKTVPISDSAGTVNKILVVAENITERKQAERRIQQLNRIYAVLSEINQLIVREREPQTILDSGCRIAVETGGFRLAWVGLLDAPDGRLQLKAHAGAQPDTLEVLGQIVGESKLGCAFTAQAIKTGMHAVCNDIEHDPLTALWRDAALQRGYRAMASFPLTLAGQTVSTFNLYAAEAGFFDEAELQLLDGLAVDISFALEISQHETERRKSEDRYARQRSALIELTGPQSLNSDEVTTELRQIVEVAARTLDVERVSIWRYSRDRSAIECVDLFELQANRHSSTASLSAVTYPAYFSALADLELIAADDAISDPRTREFAESYLRPHGIHSMLDAPISIGGVRTGVLCMEHTGTPRSWTADEKTFALAIANLVSLTQESWERRQAENELRWKSAFFEALVDSSFDGILVVDNQGRKVLQNQRMNDLWKIPPHIVEGNDNAAQIRFCASQTKNPKSFSERVAHLYSHLEEISRDEIELVNGTILDRFSSPVRDKAGNHYGRIWAFHDITQQRLLEEQFRQAQKMEAIGQLAGGVAHDFNNILAVIQGYGSLLMLDDQTRDETMEAAQQIVQASERAANLTRQLLLFSRRQIMQSRQLDLNDVVTSLTKMLQRILGEDVHLQLNLHPHALLTRADAGMIDQVLLNLVVNARDAMPEGGRLSIETVAKKLTKEEADAIPDATPGRHACLCVTDTGSGMSPEIMAHIFEPFYTTKETGKGTGLGLATVFGIVKQHDGFLTVESEIGRGTTFQIFLPAIVEADKSVDVIAAKPKPRGGTETILLAEDERSVRMLTRAVLERAGYKVLEAHDGVEALRVWEQHRDSIHLLLTDIVMPQGVSGRELAARLQAANPKLRVIFTSGYSADIAGRELELQEGQNFIQKPSPMFQLLETVRKSLDS